MNDQATIGAGLYDRAQAVLRTGRPEMAETTFASPVGRYLDPDRLAAERALFRRHPQVLCVAADLPADGWLARDVGGVPVLATRDGSGRVRAFLNTCRHRGARLVAEGSGSGRRAFACPYHAWTYGTDGSLRGVPQAWGFPGLDTAARGLRTLAVAERAGLIWVATDPATDGLELGSLAGELEALGFAGHVPFMARAFELAANWKLMMDASFEGYHFKVAHRDTIAAMFADNVQLIDEHGLNRRLYLVRSHLTPDTPAADFAFREHGNIIYFFFPATIVLVQRDHAQLTWLEPLAPDRTRVHDVALIPAPPDGEKALGHWKRNVDLYRRTLDEDYALMESMQCTMASGANDSLTFGTFEFAAARFHAQLESELKPSANR